MDEVKRGNRTVSLSRLIPEAAQFIKAVPVLIHRLPAQLNIDPAKLDGTDASLKEIDVAIGRMDPELLQEQELFSPLIAYLGEVLRAATDGYWQMKFEHGDWTPLIIGKSGTIYAPTRFYKELIELGRYASVRAFVHGTLGRKP